MFQKIRSVAGGVIFLVLCAGGALAMPASFDGGSDDEVDAAFAELPEDLELDPVEVAVEGETTDVTVPDEDEDSDETDDADGSDKPENHGKAVSTAAHCDLKGRAKGQLVSSIARDKSATAATAQAACDAALAAQEAGAVKAKPAKAAKPAKPAKAAKSAKPAKVAKPAKGPEAPEAPEVEETTTEAAPAAGPPAHAGPPADKGNSKKP